MLVERQCGASLSLHKQTELEAVTDTMYQDEAKISSEEEEKTQTDRTAKKPVGVAPR
jgi:hypothetical protein